LGILFFIIQINLMGKSHHYELTLTWTGNTGMGTSSYRAYERSHIVSIKGKPDLLTTADPAFRGDAAKHNPEDLLLTALSSCHMLSYLYVCSVAGIIVVDYTDEAVGTMTESSDGSGRFTEVILHPKVIVAEASMLEQAEALHAKANALCYIANSVNFPVKHQASCIAKKD
jgi:organic hydroperoxide reductase OsmC/OhrA